MKMQVMKNLIQNLSMFENIRIDVCEIIVFTSHLEKAGFHTSYILVGKFSIYGDHVILKRCLILYTQTTASGPKNRLHSFKVLRE